MASWRRILGPGFWFSTFAMLAASACGDDRELADLPTEAEAGAGGAQTSATGGAVEPGEGGAREPGEGGASAGMSAAGADATGGAAPVESPPPCDESSGLPSVISGAKLVAEHDGIDCSPPEGELPELRLVPVLVGVTEPLDLESPPGELSRSFLVQRTGQVRLVEDGVMRPEPFLEIAVDTKYSECGLLGIAFHPDYADNGLFYLHYITPRSAEDDPGRLIVAEYERNPDDPDYALPEPRRVLLDIPQPTNKHKGGSLEFDAEGRLLIAIGNSGETEVSGIHSDLRGKVLRILPAPDTDTYEIPEDNPQHEGWAPEVLESGLRNPWRIAVDQCTQDLFMADVGSEVFEEVNFARGGEHGNDFGFPSMEHEDCHPGWGECDPEGKTNPLGGYSHAVGCAIIGGRVYRGHAIPALRGTYVYADTCSGRIWGLTPGEDGELTEIDFSESLNVCGVKGFTSFGEDAAGELYVMSRKTGAVYRIQGF